jgi:hypothetical protein
VGWQKAAPIGTQKSLEIRENVLRGGGLEDDIRLSLDEFKSNASYLDLKKAAPDGVVGKRQQVAIDAGVRYANASAQKQALAEGMSSGEAKKAGELAGKQRRQELEDRLNKPEVSEEEGYYDRVVRKLEEMFGERRKAKKAATKQTQPPTVRRKIIDDKKLKSLMQGAPSIPIEKFDWK